MIKNNPHNAISNNHGIVCIIKAKLSIK